MNTHRIKSINIILLFLILSIFGYGQEICNNGIDDDADGLIDLNDPNCNCGGILTNTNVASLVPNPSFEQYSSLPNSVDQIARATGWINMNSRTPDYFNTNGFHSFHTPATLLPPPNGNGYAGTLYMSGWQEYFGTCLSTPLIAGTPYVLTLNVGGGYLQTSSWTGTGNGYACGGTSLPPPINLTLFGGLSCTGMALGSGSCPSSSANWVNLSNMSYSPNPYWSTLTFTFVPTTTIYAISIGGSCSGAPGTIQCPGPTGENDDYYMGTYIWYDNFILNTLNAFKNLDINKTGELCANNTKLTATSTLAGGSWQWYKNGVALVGQTTPTLNVSAGGYGSGSYTVRYTYGSSCETFSTTVATSALPPVTANATSTVLCAGNAVTLTGSGASSYTWTGGVSNGVSFSPMSTQSYTVIGIDAVTGCTNSAVTTISVNPTPTVTTITGGNSNTVCSGATVGSVIFGVTPLGTIGWTNNNPSIGLGSSGVGPSIPTFTAANVSLPTSAVITLTATSAQGCVTNALTQLTYTINVNPLPVITVSPSQTLTCGSPTVAISVTATPSSGNPSWDGGVCSGANSFIATACAPGIYTVTVKDPTSDCVSLPATVQVLASTDVPFVDAMITNPISCINQTIQVVATTTTTPVSYNWSGPSVLSGINDATATVNAGGIYTVVVTNTNTSCSSKLTVTVPSNTTVVVPTISTTGSVITCSTPTLTLFSTPSIGVTYDWSGGTGLISPSNQQNVEVNGSGVYVLSVTNATNGCVGTASINITTDTISPTISLGITSATATCFSPLVQLNATSVPSSNVIYSWTSPLTGTLSNVSISNPIASGSGIFIVSVTNTVNGCSTSATNQGSVTLVSDLNPPSVSVSSNSLTITCLNTTVTNTLTSTDAILSYVWSPNPISGGATPVFGSNGTYSANITAVNGCTTMVIVNVIEDNISPQINTTDLNQVLTCLKTTAVLSVTATPTAVNYLWSGAGVNGQVSNLVTVGQSGNYSVTATGPNGCESTAVFTVSTNTTTPSVSINASSTNTLITCSTPILSVLANVSPISSDYSYTWSNGNLTPTLDIMTAGIYSVIVTNTVNGCFTVANYSAIGSSTPPSLDILSINPIIPCGSSTVSLNASSTSTSNLSYNWSGPSIVSGGNTSSVVVDEVGIYMLTVTDPLTQCSTTSSVNVSKDNVIASFTADPTSGFAPMIVNFSNTSVNAINYSWSFGDENVSTLQNPNNTYLSQGDYTVVLVASAGLCSDTASIVISILDELTLEVPNVFTPNGDDVNDLFFIKSKGVKDFNLLIFNRWGQQLYEFNGPNASWNGKLSNGNFASDGTYYYFIKATGFDGKVIEKNGPFSLFR